MLGIRPPTRRLLPGNEHLISELMDLKWGELERLAAMLTPPSGSAQVVDPAEWVARLVELANLHQLSGRLEGDYRRIASTDSVPQRMRRAR